MKSGSGFAGREQARNCCLCGLRFHTNATHHVVASWTDLHWSLRNVNVSEFAKLVIHAWQFSFHIVSRLVRNVQISAAVFSAASFAHLRVDCARHDVARGELHLFRIVALHESFTILVAQDTAFASDCFGYEYALHAGWPNHSGRVKLNKLHIDQLSPCIVGEGHTVARVLPRVGSNPPGFANTP